MVHEYQYPAGLTLAESFTDRDLLAGWGGEEGRAEAQPAPALVQRQPKQVAQLMAVAQIPSTWWHCLAFSSKAILRLPVSKGKDREKHYPLYSCRLFEIQSAISPISSSAVLAPSSKNCRDDSIIQGRWQGKEKEKDIIPILQMINCSPANTRDLPKATQKNLCQSYAILQVKCAEARLGRHTDSSTA